MSAADLLLQVATRFWRSIGSVLSDLPQDLRAALAWRVEDGDMRWALSLMLAGWRLTEPREPKASDISQLVKQSGATWVLGQINLLRGVDGFQLFVDRARDADSEAKHKAAGVALVSALERVERTQLGLLVEMLRHPEVRKIGQALIRRFPTPGSTRPPVWGAPSEPGPGSSRGALFDRADYAPRERALRQSTRTSAALGSVVAEDPPPLPPAPAPVLDEHTVTVAFLHTLGHSEADIARLMAGPPKKTS
jgi:hypothetical protein